MFFSKLNISISWMHSIESQVLNTAALVSLEAPISVDPFVVPSYDCLKNFDSDGRMTHHKFCLGITLNLCTAGDLR